MFLFLFFESLLILTFGHFWTMFGPFGHQKRREEVKSVWTDPFRAATELLEPSCGRFGRTSAEKQGFWDSENGAARRFRSTGVAGQLIESLSL